MWCLAALALLCTFPWLQLFSQFCLPLFMLLHTVASCGFLLTKSEQPPTHPSPSDLKPGTKTQLNFKTFPPVGISLSPLSPLCFSSSPLQKHPISKAGALFGRAIGSVDSFDRLLGRIAVAGAAKPALAPALGVRRLPLAARPLPPPPPPTRDPPFASDRLAARGLSGFCCTNPKGAAFLEVTA